MINEIILVIIGFTSGVVIAGGIFAFIAIVGVVPRLAQKTNTKEYIKVYENFIMIGGVFGALTVIREFELMIPIFLIALFAFFNGIFVGCMAVSIAEILDVIPIMTRRLSLKVGIPIFIMALAIGKLIGSLMYFLIPGFIVPK